MTNGPCGDPPQVGAPVGYPQRSRWHGDRECLPDRVRTGPGIGQHSVPDGQRRDDPSFRSGGAKSERPFLSEDGAVESDSLPDGHPLILLRAFLQDLPDRNYLAYIWIFGRDRGSSSQLSTQFAAETLSSGPCGMGNCKPNGTGRRLIPTRCAQPEQHLSGTLAAGWA